MTMEDYTSKYSGEEVEEILDNAVVAEEQTLTDRKKMQARKNLGLYYEETTATDTIAYDGISEGKETVPYEVGDLVRIGNVNTTLLEMLGSSLTFLASGEEQTLEITDENTFEDEDIIFCAYAGVLFFAITKRDNVRFQTSTIVFPHAGMWVLDGGDIMLRFISLTSNEPIFEDTTVHKIDEKWIPQVKTYEFLIGEDMETTMTKAEFESIYEDYASGKTVMLKSRPESGEGDNVWSLSHIIQCNLDVDTGGVLSYFYNSSAGMGYIYLNPDTDKVIFDTVS